MDSDRKGSLATLSFIVQPSRLAWKNSGDKPFSAGGRGISIYTKRSRGKTELPPGTYNLSVSGAAGRSP